VVKMWLAHPKTEVTIEAANLGGLKLVVGLLLEQRPQQFILRMFQCKLVHQPTSVLKDELCRWKRRSALALLSAVEHRQGSLKVSDVLRAMVEEFARFYVVEPANSVASSDVSE
jgi:hypothetical protein